MMKIQSKMDFALSSMTNQFLLFLIYLFILLADSGEKALLLKDHTRIDKMSIKAQAEDVVEGCRALQCIPLKPDPSHGPSEVSWAGDSDQG